MKRSSLGLIVATVVMLWGAARADSAGPAGTRLGQPNAAHFPEVVLYAYPTDQRGALVGGLSASAFRVTENGKPTEIMSVESEGGSLDICLAIDCSPSMLEQNKLDYARAAAQAFMAQLAPEDQASLVTFADRSTLEQPLTRERTRLLQAIERTATRGNATAFRDALYWSISQVALRPRQEGSVLSASPARADARRIVLALTDGNDNQSRTSTQQAIAYARSQGVALCPVALGDNAQTTEMELLARETGGVYLRAPGPQDLQRLYVSLAQQLRREYRIRLKSPTPAADATRREIEVVASGVPGTGSTWYQAPGQGSLLVTVPNTPSGEAVSAATVSQHRLDPRLIGGAVLIILGLGAGAVGLFVWLGQRGNRLTIRDSNPRLDLLPLWVKEGSTRVGRGGECELVLDSTQVSRVHARIEAGAGVFLLVDEGSSNGTYVNGKRVRRYRELQVGDVIRFGDREFKFAGELRAI